MVPRKPAGVSIVIVDRVKMVKATVLVLAEPKLYPQCNFLKIKHAHKLNKKTTL